MQVLDAGQTVRHGQYGVGTVTESDNERTSVEFDDHGLKKFVTTLWTAEVVGEIAGRPKRPKRRRKSATSASKAAAKPTVKASKN
ncbi:MAG TPA: hypothetical protein VGT03_10315 [Candidatus Acidoferrales bacterium]|nr:hypothetical protein [Candidatus Acidoferrales bacterium]